MTKSTAPYSLRIGNTGAAHVTTITRRGEDYNVDCSCGDGVTSLGKYGLDHTLTLAKLHRLTGERMVDIG